MPCNEQTFHDDIVIEQESREAFGREKGFDANGGMLALGIHDCKADWPVWFWEMMERSQKKIVACEHCKKPMCCDEENLKKLWCTECVDFE